jgi:hypothetical protein
LKIHPEVLSRDRLEVRAIWPKVVVADLNGKPRGRRATGPVAKNRVRDAEGHVKTLYTLDLGSPTFGADLQYVFGRNVAKARRDNKRVTGSADIAGGKR